MNGLLLEILMTPRQIESHIRRMRTAEFKMRENDSRRIMTDVFCNNTNNSNEIRQLDN